MGLVGVIVILMPDLPILLFYVVPAPLWVGGIFSLMDVFGVFSDGNRKHRAPCRNRLG